MSLRHLTTRHFVILPRDPAAFSQEDRTLADRKERRRQYLEVERAMLRAGLIPYPTREAAEADLKRLQAKHAYPLEVQERAPVPGRML